jgi:hypothetical protein
MSVEANRQVNTQILGDGLNSNNSFAAAANASSPAQDQLLTLALGSNTVTVPSSAVACTIVPPAGNTNSITLKGVTGDTGIRIHNTDPTSLAIHSSVSAFVLTAATTTTGVRLHWT